MKKPTVVLLHGWGVDKSTLNNVANHLKALEYQTLSLDFPGFGEQNEPETAWNVDDYANWTIAKIAKSGLTNVILFGHSFGCRVILKIAAYSPNDLPFKIDKIIITGGAGIRPKRGLDYYCKVYSYKLMKRFLPKLTKNAGSDDYQKTSGIMRQIFNNVVNEDLTYLLPQNPYETLLIWGQNDDATPLADGIMMEKMMPNAGLAKIANARHYAFLDQPHVFMSILTSYLR